MDGFGLLVGHAIGDFIFQNDWMAKNKTNPWVSSWRQEKWLLGHITCTVHCLCYTLAVWACSYWWMPWWGLLACFVIHWPIDRFRLAAWWMNHVSGQKFFASKEHPMFPWSIVVVDNTFHLLTLFVIGIIAHQ